MEYPDEHQSDKTLISDEFQVHLARRSVPRLEIRDLSYTLDFRDCAKTVSYLSSSREGNPQCVHSISICGRW